MFRSTYGHIGAIGALSNGKIIGNFKTQNVNNIGLGYDLYH